MPSTFAPTVTTAPADSAATNDNDPARQQTFEFWQPEASAPVASSKKRPKAKPEKTTAKGKARTKRTQRWANVTVATLRRPESLPTQASEPERSSKPDAFGDEAPPTGGQNPAAARQNPAAAVRQNLMADLRNRAAAIATSPAMENADTFSTGSIAMDTWLPGGGLQRGRICEWVATRESGGAGTLSMITAASAIADQTGPLIVIDPTETFYASGAIACGIPSERIVWCRCSTRRDSVWALDQALRCRAVAAVWAMLPWHLGDRDARRLQLAAEVGRTPGLFVLTAGEAHRPSFAPVRFHVDPVRSTDAAKRLQSQAKFSRPPVDTRTVRVRMSESQQAILAITPDAKLHTLPHPNRQTKQSTRPEYAEARHEAVAVSLAARLADPTSPNRDAIRGDAIRRESTRRQTG